MTRTEKKMEIANTKWMLELRSEERAGEDDAAA
jgi:hypothetical protein